MIGKHAGIAVGATFAATALVAGPVSTISFNIARSIAPAVISGNSRALNALWAYVTASLVAAVIAALIHRVLRDLPEGKKPRLEMAIQAYERSPGTIFKRVERAMSSTGASQS